MSNTLLPPTTGNISLSASTVTYTSPTWTTLNTGTPGGVYTISNPTGVSFNTSTPGMTVSGTVDAGDVIIDGASVKEALAVMKVIQDRLAILVPDPAKLEKFAALKASYEHYKLLEKLCTDNPPDDE